MDNNVTIRSKSISEIEHDLKNIENELHQMNIFMCHICKIFDSLIVDGDLRYNGE